MSTPSSGRRHSRSSRALRFTVLTCLLGGALASVEFSTSAARGAEADSPWSVAYEGSSPGVVFNESGISCVSLDFCMVVGAQTQGATTSTLIESWDGTNWSTVASPNAPGSDSQLTGISCSSATDCVAVGWFNNGDLSNQTLIEAWDGVAWTIVAGPTPGYPEMTLAGVSCADSTDCVAVGSYSPNDVNGYTLVESWNGTIWSIISSPNVNPGYDNDSLAGVSCTSSSNCVAVGTDATGSPNPPLIESWNGTMWSLDTVPSTNGDLDGVSCGVPSACTAVGINNNTGQPLIEGWNGSQWSATTAPLPNGRLPSMSVLNGVSCPSVDDCVAVGYFHPHRKKPLTETLVDTWNGTSWSFVPSPNPSSDFNDLLAASCLQSSMFCDTAGTYAPPDSSNYNMVETDVPLAITTTSVPAGSVGFAYSTTLDASGANPPYKWRVVSGNLPPGLKLAKASGSISGTPHQSGTFSFTVQVTDTKTTNAPRLQQTASSAFSITVS